MKLKPLILVSILAPALLAAGEPAEAIEAPRTGTPVKLDGVLDEAVWKTAPVYSMELPKSSALTGRGVQETGSVRLAWDATHLYIGLELEDSDLVAEGDADGLHHYRMGDVVEVFLKPKHQTWYWEFYVTPAGKKSSFFMPGRGRRGLESNFNYRCGLEVAARCAGTLNDWKDRDRSWTAEMAVPVGDLESFGDRFCPDAEWLVFFGRFNFSRYLSEKELTMRPPLRGTDNHLYEDYSPLKLRQ